MAALLKQNSKTNMTKNREKLWYFKKIMIVYIFAILLTTNSEPKYL